VRGLSPSIGLVAKRHFAYLRVYEIVCPKAKGFCTANAAYPAAVKCREVIRIMNGKDKIVLTAEEETLLIPLFSRAIESKRENPIVVSTAAVIG